MITWPVVRQQLGKHVSVTTDRHATITDIFGNSVFYTRSMQSESESQQPVIDNWGNELVVRW
jgi:hypothetical protein